MRNLYECQAEVFRRSEKRIKARKQRKKHMLLACIPLVLCITLFSAFILPNRMPAGSKDAGTADGLTENKSESTLSSVVKIDVSGNGISRSYTKASDILRISEQLYAYGTRYPENNSAAGSGVMGEDYKENVDDVPGSTGDSANTGYTVTLVMHKGKNTEYYLSGNTLKNLTTNQTYILSQKQVNELKDLLGIPNP